jgi:FkbM family methyltransferase
MLQSKSYQNIFAFEPDPTSFSLLKKNLRHVENLTLFSKGLWSRKTNLSFFSENDGLMPGSAFCKEDKNGNFQVDTLDNIMGFYKKSISLIKMDTPSGSMEIIKGMQKIIVSNRPKLVIGIYHEINTLFEMINFLTSIVKNYKYFLRHNELNVTECFLYAVPK